MTTRPITLAHSNGLGYCGRPSNAARSCVTVPYEVLVIDDEPGDVELVRRAIQDGPFACHISVAANGIEGISLLKGHAQDGMTPAGTPPGETPSRIFPDLILLDLNMPCMNGREFLKAIKLDPDLDHIPVVVLTTSNTEHDIAQAYALGAAGYVTKPVDIEQLYKTIHSVEEYWFSVVRIPRRVM